MSCKTRHTSLDDTRGLTGIYSPKMHHNNGRNCRGHNWPKTCFGSLIFYSAAWPTHMYPWIYHVTILTGVDRFKRYTKWLLIHRIGWLLNRFHRLLLCRVKPHSKSTITTDYSKACNMFDIEFACNPFLFAHFTSNLIYMCEIKWYTSVRSCCLHPDS